MDNTNPEVLDRCLRGIQTGRLTLEECLTENPADAKALEPLLRVAAETHTQLAPADPSQAFLTHSPKRVMNLVRARLKTPTPSKRRRLAYLGLPAYRLAGVLLALTLLIGSVGVAYASGEALPGDNLYGVKRGLERAALAISPSAEGDSELFLKHANRRIAEVEELVLRGRGSDLGAALEGYENAVLRGLEIASEHGAGLGDLEVALDRHGQVLARVMAEAPEQALPGLTRALENSKNGRNVVEQIRSGQHPSDLAPGQLRKTPDPSEGAIEAPPGQPQKDDRQGRDLAPGQLRKTPAPDANASD